MSLKDKMSDILLRGCIIKAETDITLSIGYVKEMFCDRLAASKIYQGDKYTDSHPFEYFSRGKVKRLIHPETSALLELLLVMLRDKGEAETFRYLKQEVLTGKPFPWEQNNLEE